MKKILSLTLVLAMALTLFAGCGGTEVNNQTSATAQAPTETATEATTEAAAVAPGSALEILENTWNVFGEEEKFPAFGGAMDAHNAKAEEDENYQIPEGPGDYDMAYAESLPYTLQIPQELMENVDEAATLVHMMLANNFTAGVLHLTEGTDAESFATSVHEGLMSHRWMCGFPEKELVAVVGGEYVVVAFGLADAMDSFRNHLAEAYPDVQVAYNENIA